MDRFTRGFVAGVIAGAVAGAFTKAMEMFGLTVLWWGDASALVTFMHQAQSLGESIVAGYSMLLFNGLLGIGYAYLILATTGRNDVFKGFIYSALLWFLIFAGLTLARAPGFSQTTVGTAVTNAVAAGLWGIVVTYVLRLLDRLGVPAGETASTKRER